MIRYALQCDEGHSFEAWFSSSEDYESQEARGLVECPTCGSVAVTRAVMAPAVRTSKGREMSTNAEPDFEEVARKVRAHIRNNYDYVGPDFASEARAIHEGAKPERLIYGETTPEERTRLAEEGVPCAPLPEPFAPTPPKKAN
ncbi:MAG: DUF1178 family protein [Oceanicaulis sp.]|uniref:DUF1178 family protein n=1 Tax=Glycocaulis sp. TaxID=1969725 RepID=UPI0025C0E8C2|nr:DUF1178 family protein [Glycocaulis sp.]MCC5980383.1 DUF1178 family protein [Oceanicaulis sp.]MCH8520317.1 DUF1178 family protein [Glycocaulis sp.]